MIQQRVRTPVAVPSVWHEIDLPLGNDQQPVDQLAQTVRPEVHVIRDPAGRE